MRASLTALLVLALESTALANGGPFLVRHPVGDPAMKGTAAPILPDLMPGRESRLQVVREDLSFQFSSQAMVHVKARYTIRNPSQDEIELDIGFPILRGLYRPSYGGGMGSPGWPGPPALRVRRNGRHQPTTIIGNSEILTRIRQHAFEVIERGLAGHAPLKSLRERIASASGKPADELQAQLKASAIKELGWSEKDAKLLANFARAVFSQTPRPEPPAAENKEIPEPRVRKYAEEGGGRHPQSWTREEIPFDTTPENRVWSFGVHNIPPPYLGPLASIGELKATQLFAYLASRFEPAVATSYEKIFSSWGGEVREQAVDFKTGTLRPRESKNCPTCGDTLYARVDYFDESMVVDEGKKRSCKEIVADLPVTFTFAPMNLIHTKVTFPRKSTQVLEFEYSQYAFTDDVEPASYQLAYLVHPASFWGSFGPIRVSALVPPGVGLRASIPMKKAGTKRGFTEYRAVLKDKTGELLVAIPRHDLSEVVRLNHGRYNVDPPSLSGVQDF